MYTDEKKYMYTDKENICIQIKRKYMYTDKKKIKFMNYKKKCLSAAGWIMSMNNSSDTMGNRTRDLPTAAQCRDQLRHRLRR
jgi:hypothetical protein